jgi:hypothetical protein
MEVEKLDRKLSKVYHRQDDSYIGKLFHILLGTGNKTHAQDVTSKIGND